ncbi:peptide chain release factor N(5)-glutamine methyltransferase [Ruminococcaceae bacterium OttesenSCG-928-O06]|nr:peptide chain release factor N(5)-glutamine methyltransferase [Ruminococcaceae bacterium OttesenSCG-928-O06]
MDIREAYNSVKALLGEAGVENAGFEAQVLLQHFAGASRFAQGSLAPDAWQRVWQAAQKRAARAPLQYIVGAWPFLGLEIMVGPGVLVPRSETEEVCLYAAALCGGAPRNSGQPDEPQGACVQQNAAPKGPAAGQGLAILDLCAGSGALALGLQSLLPAARVAAVELHEDAFAWLGKNIAAFAAANPGAGAPRAVQADALTYYKELAARSLDLLISNPPYVTPAEYARLAPELYHEPKEALVPPAGEDGLLFYRGIARDYMGKLKPGGYLVFEIGAAQGPAVRDILVQNGYGDVEIHKDLAGLDRIAVGRAPAV